ncbi:MAG: type I DNA topoisomerase, partial [Alphaproteobacteria bacterium]|nr:type I DNA topoisomerase [Alphaproteobacteria bacterium]
MLNLVIVESAAKAKTISTYLNSIPSLKSKGEFIVLACFGHIQDLPAKTLGIDKTNWQVTYNINSKKKDILHKISLQAKQALTLGGKIYIASDMDVEGNAIASHIKSYLCLSKRCHYDRVIFNEITKSALEAAFLHPIDIDQRSVDAQETRRILDRIIGYELSPLLWRRFKTQNLSAGRVQSAALHIIVTRHKEMQEHIYKPYWKLTGSFEINIGTQSITSDVLQLKAVGKNMAMISSSEDALIMLQSVVKVPVIEWYASFTKSLSNKSPPPSFTTSTLQQTCFQRYGLSTNSTMQIAQSLYEAGLITYMRTDSTSISEEMQRCILKHICDTYGTSYVCTTQLLEGRGRKSKNKSPTVQGAHEAIRPTSLTTRTILTDGHDNDLKEIHQKVYDLIWKRTIASQMADAIYATISYTITSTEHTLYGSTNIRTFDGYQIIYTDVDTCIDTDTDTDKDTYTDTNEIDSDANSVHGNSRLKCTELSISLWENLLNACSSKHIVIPKCFSMVPNVERPKPLLNEATLVKQMEIEGIGRPSTYASIVNKLYDKKYIENGTNVQHSFELENFCHIEGDTDIKTTTLSVHVGGNEKNKMVPTKLGYRVIEYLEGITPYLLDCKFTRTMEADLDKIAKDNSFSLKNI